MHKQIHSPSLKPDSKKANVQQHNVLLSLVREKKFWVNQKLQSPVMVSGSKAPEKLPSYHLATVEKSTCV